MGYVVVKYIRLSLDEDKTDSCSISSQRKILDQYLAGLEIEDIQVMEFVDNDYSGMNIERPGLQKLLALVTNGMVDCVIVKDFSRLCRNSLDMGYFMETVFPLYKVRFLSLGDNYDSEKQRGANSLEVNFKLVLNESNSRDMSKKIRREWLSRALAGQSVTKNCTFGYKLDEERKMVPAPEVASTVRRIFTLAELGYKISQIAKVMYEEQRPTPAFSKGYTKNRNPEFECVWSYSKLHSILRDEQYTGTFVAGKQTTLEVGSGKQRAVPSEDWIRIPDHHPAIISTEQFETVQTILRKRKPSRHPKRPARANATAKTVPLKGKIVCGVCGHAMTYMPSANSAFRCKFTRSVPEAGCYRLSVPVGDLEIKVLQLVQERAEDLQQAALREKAEKANHTLQTGDAKPSFTQLYEKMRGGEISSDEFARMKKGALAKDKRQQNRKMLQRGVGIPIATYSQLETTKLTTETVNGMIDRVRIFPGGDVVVDWKESL